jgi:GMP synthase (glutamine-hydrolysing)
MHSKILILDFGSQVTQLIARRVRDAGVFSEVYPYDVGDDFVRNYGASGVILSGSHNSTLEGDSPRAPQAVFEAGRAGARHLLRHADHGGPAGRQGRKRQVREFGYAEVRARGHTKLLNGINDFVTDEGHGMLKVWMSHGDKVLEMPEGFKLMGSTDSCPVAAMADEERRFYALQFHPEVTHTSQGEAIIGRFVHEICGCKSDWNMPDYIGEAVEKIRAQVGTDEVILGLSGGVDSSVAAALIHRAIGDQLTCVFVDHGLLRKDEGKMVMDMFSKTSA